MPARPKRVKIRDELGRLQSLPDDPASFALREAPSPILLILGLGPHPQLLSSMVHGAEIIFFLEAPPMARQMPPSWHAAIPASWQRISPRQLASLPLCRQLSYLPGPHLFPSFWQPILARLQNLPPAQPRPTIWLPGPAHGLVRQELAEAAHGLGLTPRLLPQHIPAPVLRQFLAEERPRLVLSLNFHGLDPWGETQAILEAAGVPVLVWAIDNPFHLLAGIKTRAWRRLPLAVTDPWSLRPLRTLGGRPLFLPLATSPSLFAPRKAPQEPTVLFVGRTRFPDHDRFFAAAHPPAPLLQRAQTLARYCRTPHFAWWWARLGAPRLWPGTDIRTVGCGAETASQTWRARILQAIAHHLPLTVVGDLGWSTLLPQARLLPPVDYYGPLADLYAQAAITLNLTSLLLPHGLTQRHFDVWACGGFLLSDATPGLRLFPRELTDPIIFATPNEALDRIRYFLRHELDRRQLAATWQAYILTHHTYRQRLATILEVLPSI